MNFTAKFIKDNGDYLFFDFSEEHWDGPKYIKPENFITAAGEALGRVYKADINYYKEFLGKRAILVVTREDGKEKTYTDDEFMYEADLALS